MESGKQALRYAFWELVDNHAINVGDRRIPSRHRHDVNGPHGLSLSSMHGSHVLTCVSNLQLTMTLSNSSGQEQNHILKGPRSSQ